MKHNEKAAFHWDDGTPSIFLSDRRFWPTASGKSIGQTATQSIEAHRQETGLSRGTIHGISTRADELLKNRFGGAYSKAKPASFFDSLAPLRHSGSR
jgi:hypothetical protein